MPPGLLEDADALTLILKQLRVENHLTTSLLRLRNFSAVNKYAREHLNAHNAHNAELARDLLGVDMGMSPLALATMILDMSRSERANLVTLAEQWNTPYAIEEDYFYECAALELPRLSSFVTSIGEAAFAHCTSLIVAEWHASLLTIVRDNAFSSCERLTLKEWRAPKLTAIGNGVFEECESLVLSTWDSPALTTIHGEAFKNCGSLTLEDWHAPLLSVIGEEAFSGCSDLKLPNGLPGDLNHMVIENSAFAGCHNLSARAWTDIESVNAGALS